MTPTLVPLPRRDVEGFLEELEEEAPVGESGERVMVGKVGAAQGLLLEFGLLAYDRMVELLDAVMDEAVLDGDGQVGPEGLEEYPVVFGVGALLVALDGEDYDPFLDEEGYHDDARRRSSRARPPAGDILGTLRIRVLHEDGPAGC